MTASEMERLGFEIATEYAEHGLGWAQEAVVLRGVVDRLRQREVDIQLSIQQMILRAWHNLFRQGTLCWGFDLTHPTWPHFHVPPRCGL